MTAHVHTEPHYGRFTGEGWWPESCRDGGAHLGRLGEDDMVEARCGRVFTPEPEPIGGGLVWWRAPVDERHACPDCVLAEVTAEQAEQRAGVSV